MMHRLFLGIHDCLDLAVLRHVMHYLAHSYRLVTVAATTARQALLRHGRLAAGATELAVELGDTLWLFLTSEGFGCGCGGKCLRLRISLCLRLDADAVHLYEVLGVHVDAKADELLVIVKDGVEVLQEQVAEDVGAAISLVERVLSDGELADLTLV